MLTIRDFAEINAGRRCTFVHYDFLSRPGTYTGKVVGYYENNSSLWVLVSPDINIGEPRNKTIGDNYFHWRVNCENYCLVDMDKITLLQDKPEDKPKWPHLCNCGQPALVFFQFIECSSYICKNYKKQYA